MTDMRREILTCYLDFNVTGNFDAANGLSHAELKSYVGLVAEFADILSKFLVSDLMNSKGAKYFIDATNEVESFLKGVIAINLRWKDGLEIVDADVLTNELINMLRDAVGVLVIERYFPDITYEIDAGTDYLYEFVVLEDAAVCKLRSEKMAHLVNKIEGLLVKLNRHNINVELHIRSDVDSFQLPPLANKRHFMDIKQPEEEVECVTFAHDKVCENKVFKIDLTGKTRKYYLDDVSSEYGDYLARRSKHGDILRLRVKPVRSVRRGVFRPITRYSFVACLNEKDEGQGLLRYPDVDGRRR